MKVMEYAPYVCHELIEAGRPMLQTELTTAVWGTSGTGNTTLTGVLFPFMVRKGWMTLEPRGRSKVFTVTDKGRELAEMNKALWAQYEPGAPLHVVKFN